MAVQLFSQSGTLTGVDEVIDIQVLTGAFTPGYVEVHNLHTSNTYSCSMLSGSQTVVFRIPAGRKLGIPGPVAKITLNGTGAYSVFGGPTRDELPSLDSTTQGAIGSSISPPDNITIEDTGTVIQVKDVGISTAKIAQLAVTTTRLADSAVTNVKLDDASITFNKINTGAQAIAGQVDTVNLAFTGANPADGNTVRVQYGASDVTYTFRVAPAVPTDVLIGAAAQDTCNNLATDINANQPVVLAQSITSTQPVCAIMGNVTTLVQAGDTFIITVVGAAITSINIGSSAAEYHSGVDWQEVAVDAPMAAADAIAVGFSSSVNTFTFVVRDITGAIKYWDGQVNYGAARLLLIFDDSGAVNFAVGDTLQIIAHVA